MAGGKFDDDISRLLLGINLDARLHELGVEIAPIGRPVEKRGLDLFILAVMQHIPLLERQLLQQPFKGVIVEGIPQQTYHQGADANRLAALDAHMQQRFVLLIHGQLDGGLVVALGLQPLGDRLLDGLTSIVDTTRLDAR